MIALPLLMFHMAVGQETSIQASISKVMANTLGLEKVYACPRCRRAKPPGPRKKSSSTKGDNK